MKIVAQKINGHRQEINVKSNVVGVHSNYGEFFLPMEMPETFFVQTKPNLHYFSNTFYSCDVDKMRDIREEVGKKTLKKEMENP